MSPLLNLLLAVVGGPTVIVLVVLFCRWSANQHAEQYSRDVERVHRRRSAR